MKWSGAFILEMESILVEVNTEKHMKKQGYLFRKETENR